MDTLAPTTTRACSESFIAGAMAMLSSSANATGNSRAFYESGKKAAA